ncbi:hypothetical protein M419DRAFT_80212 [Trichoderma reesei RUT C-30]|uniref:Uncharacterized protein n=1 Tax=Hypocrea jecorina (strain ATCC 56765 / BCRC 32924 / NRRL 11460 / Rut C-30) TaxID=1344414 RepID=A0A024S9J4_HYPJR|nr:hypothetical protein M419DRAFT_80212 [Trichoderma reesei RUT C-30]
MDGLPQRPEADASLPSPQRLDEERVLSKKPKHARRSLAPSAAASSSSSSTMVHPSAADRKRKQAAISASSEDGAAKRVRIAATDRDLVVTGTAQPSRYDMSQHVLAEVWQHIFSFVPPRSLGNLMCVNRLFHRYLDPASTFKVSAPDSDLPSSLPKQSPNTIWRASRRFHWPSMPSPLSGRSELDMWRLACSRSCQFCGCRADETDYAGDPLRWSRGPGNDTVSPVFQFFVASCGQCLAKNSIKEVDLLLSPSKPSFIAAGAPTVFVTADLNVVTRQIMRNSPIPTGVQLTKVFWPAQLESLQAELGDAKRFGTAAVEEWVKGLDSRGAKANRDASRWDNWYLSGGVRQMRKQSSSTQIIPSSDDRQVRQSQTGIQAAQSQGQDHTDSTTRADLSKLADKVINGQWDGGGSITGRNLATFVTQVLTCVRDQYHADSAKNNASSMRRLTLDDLRWIFTQKIAPLAKRPGVEVFSCNKCPTSKRYSLPSVIQHYCHKHSGKEANMSVHWKEEWTAELPFKPAPGAERQSLNNTNKGDAAHRELAYRTNISSNPHIEETGFRVHEAPARMSAQISAREIEARGGGTWETAHVRSRTVDSRHAVPESRSHVETYYVHREHEPHTREPPISYPYYPHMERQRQQAHAALEVRHASRQPWTTSYYNPPMSSAAAYHYAEPTRSHDRYGVVDVRNLPHEQYIERPVIYYGQRATPMPTISTIPAGSRIDTAPASRVYSEYPSRYQLVERVSRELELDIE